MSRRGGMRAWFGTVLAALLLQLILAGAARPCPPPPDLGALRAETLEQINAARTAARLVPLSAERRLERAAQDHACTLARQDRVSHRGILGTGLRLRLWRVGYRFAMANENLAAGLETPAQLVAGWMGSPRHRGNILAADSRDFGLGAALGRDARIYWVMVSARLR